MSVETLPHPVFEVVEKPDTLDVQSIGQIILDLTTEHVPFDQFEGVSSLSEALKIKKADCFAQTRYGVKVVQEALDLQPATTLTASRKLFCHANVATNVPAHKEEFDQVVFIEPPVYKGRKGVVQTIEDRATSMANGLNDHLANLMADNLPEAMASESFCHYYFIDPDFPEDRIKTHPHEQPWLLKSTEGIRHYERIKKDGYSFVITDSMQGESMLMAISGLIFLKKNDRETYSDLYEDLMQYVPDFMYFPPPNRLANV